MSAARVLQWVERAAAALVLGFLAWYLVRHWHEVAAYRWTVQWSRLALASVLVVIVYSGFVLVWRRLLGAFGGSLSVVDAHRVWYLGNLGRYVPGKLLQLAGTAYMARIKGVSPVVTIAASLASQLFVLGGGLVVAAVTLPELAGDPRIKLAGLSFAMVFALVGLTPIFGMLHRAALRLARRPELYVPIALRERAVVLVATTSLMAIFGVAFYFFVTAVTTAERDALLPLVGIHAAAYLAGYLAIFAPGGLGIREGAYALLLAIYVPASVAVAIAILARLWVTLCELAVVAVLVARYGTGDLRTSAGTAPRIIHG